MYRRMIILYWIQYTNSFSRLGLERRSKVSNLNSLLLLFPNSKENKNKEK